MPWRFHNPVEIVAGPGRLSEIATLVRAQKILYVSSSGFKFRGLTDRVERLLAGRQVEIFDRVNPNPALDELDGLIREYRAFNPGQIVALGGGSVMDTAKVLSVFLGQEGDCPLSDHFRKTKALERVRAVDLVLLPTTSGTGAEVTPFATVWDSKEMRKFSLDHPAGFARSVLLDPELTLGLPRKSTLYTGLDALSHALESSWNTHANPISRLYAQAALQRIVHSLPRVLSKGEDLEGRRAMQEAALMAGLAISSTRTAIAHAISYPLTLHYAVPHGLAASFSLSAILRLCVRKKVHLDLESNLVKRILGLLDSLALPQEMEQFVQPDQILSHIEEMWNPARSRNFPVALNQEELYDLLTASLL